MPEKIIPAPNVPPFVTFVTSAVPMVFDNSMSYYEALCALWKWMQDDVVNVINNNAAVTENYIDLTNEYTAKFIELKNYVDNYFDNLDVQEEINNKLDQMAEDGTLEEIMADYLEAKVAWTFDTVAEMKASENLVNGSYARTLGYHTINDGGGAIYKITNTGTANEEDVIAVGSLFANLISPVYATAQMFGIKSDGITDCTSLISDFLNYCMANNKKAYFPEGTYLLSPETITVSMLTGKSLTIEGNYKSTIFKRKSGELGPTKWNRLFTFTVDDNNTGHAGDITIKNLMIDSNRRGQSNATSGYEYEFSMDLYFRATSDSHISNVYINDLYCYDGVADHIDFSGSDSNYVENVYITNFLAEHREGTRFDIDFPGYCLGNIYITNAKGKRLHFEYNSDPVDYSKVFITDCEFDEASIEGKTDIMATNLRVNEHFVIGRSKGMFDNCIINMDGAYERSYVMYSEIDFANTKFLSHASSVYSSDTNATDVSFLFIRDNSTVKFDNCEFKYMDTAIDTFTARRNYFIFSHAPTQAGERCTIYVNNTKFSGRNIYAAFCYANNTWYFKDCDFGNTNNLAMKVIASFPDLVVDVDGVKLSSDRYFADVNGYGATLTGRNLDCNVTNFYIDTTKTTFTSNMTVDLHRRIHITEPLTRTYMQSFEKGSTTDMCIAKNDEFVLNSDHNPHKWIAKYNIAATVYGYSSSIDSNINTMFDVISGNCRGETANRPTCYLSKGFEYYDETLGKPIYYNGSGWKDATGTTV